MKILMVSSFLPYPLTSGGHIRLYNLLKNLSKKYEVTLLCEKRDFQAEKDIEQVRKFCKKVITVKRKKQWTLGNILKSVFSFNPFLTVGHTSSEMKDKIRHELVANNFDLIHVETFYVMQNVPKTNIPIVLAEHNIEYSVYKRFVDNSPLLLKPFLNWDVQKIKLIEKSFWKKVKILIAVSEKEKKIMNADAVVQNGVDVEKFKAQGNFMQAKFDEKDKKILFIGDFKWLENRDTAEWIIKKIWPEIKVKSSFKVKLWIVGKSIPDNIKNLTKDPNVIFDQNASADTYLIYKKSFVLVSPIRVGGGTSFKILEAMASGVPVVTTSLGAEGITSGDELIKADTVEDIVRKIVKLFNDKYYYEKVAKSARKLIEEKYDWKKITRKLEKVYENASL